MAAANNLYGVILAAGTGARLRPLSFHQPKPLLPICNKPIMQHQIEYMRDIGINKFRIVVGHLGRSIMEYFQDGSAFGVQIRYVMQEKQLGIAHAVYQLEDELDGPFLLFLGDIFLVPGNLSKMVDIFYENKAAAVLAVMHENRAEYVRRNFAVSLSNTNRVIKVVEKPRYIEDKLKGCGVYLFDLPVFDAIRHTPRTAMRDEYEITTSIQILIDDGFPVYPAEVVEWDMNVTVPCDLLNCNLRLLDKTGKKQLIGKNVQMPSGMNIQESVVGENVVFKHAIDLRRSLVMPNTVIHSSRDMEDVIISGDAMIQCPARSVEETHE